MITIMRSRLTASLATIAVTSATLMGAGAGTASAQGLPPFIPQHLIPQHLQSDAEALFSQARAAIPAELWNAVGSSGMVYQDISGGLREGIEREINGYRVSRGLNALEPNPELDREAQGWADHLAAGNRVYHNQRLLNAGKGENIVAAGTHCGAVCLVDLWKKSPGHHVNLVDAHYKSAGMGIAYGHGKVFVVHNFAY